MIYVEKRKFTKKVYNFSFLKFLSNAYFILFWFLDEKCVLNEYMDAY